MRKYNITAAAVASDFSRRGIKPDQECIVTQGILKLWRLNQEYIGELRLNDLIITSQSSYYNTISPQDIADDMMVESELTTSDIAMLTASDLGRMGGSAKTEAKASSSKENGKKGGRPKKESK